MSLTVEKILDNYCTNLNKIVLYMKGKQSDMKDLAQLRVPDHMLNPSTSEINLNIDLLKNVERIKGSEILADLRHNISDSVFDSFKFNKSLMREALKSNVFRRDPNELKIEVDELKNLHLREPQPMEKFLDVVQSKMLPNQSTKRKMELSQFADSRDGGVEDSIEMLLIKRLAFLEKRMPRELGKYFEQAKHTLGSIMIDYLNKIEQLDILVLSNRDQNESLKQKLEEYMKELRARRKAETLAHDRYMHLTELMARQKELCSREVKNLQQKLEACRNLIGMTGENFLADDYEIVFGNDAQPRVYQTNEIPEADEKEEAGTPLKQSSAGQHEDTPIKNEADIGQVTEKDFGFESLVEQGKSGADQDQFAKSKLQKPDAADKDSSKEGPTAEPKEDGGRKKKKKKGKAAEAVDEPPKVSVQTELQEPGKKERAGESEEQEKAETSSVKSGSSKPGSSAYPSKSYVSASGRNVIRVTPEQLISRLKQLELEKNKWTQYIKRLEDKHKLMDSEHQAATEELSRLKTKYKNMIMAFNQLAEQAQGSQEGFAESKATEDNFVEKYSRLLYEYDELRRITGGNLDHLASQLQQKNKALNAAMSTIRGLEQQGILKGAELRRLYEIVQASNQVPQQTGTSQPPMFRQAQFPPVSAANQPRPAPQPVSSSGSEVDQRMYDRALQRCNELKEQIMQLKRRNAAMEDEIYKTKNREKKMEQALLDLGGKERVVEFIYLKGSKARPDDLIALIESQEEIIKKRTRENEELQVRVSKLEERDIKPKDPSPHGSAEDLPQSQVLYASTNPREKETRAGAARDPSRQSPQADSRADRDFRSPPQQRADAGLPQRAAARLQETAFDSPQSKKLEELYSYSRHLLQRYATKIDDLKEQVMALKKKCYDTEDEMLKAQVREAAAKDKLEQIEGQERIVEFVYLRGEKTNSEELLAKIESLEKLVQAKTSQTQELERKLLGADQKKAQALTRRARRPARKLDTIEEEEEPRDEGPLEVVEQEGIEQEEVDSGDIEPLHTIDDETLEEKLLGDGDYLKHVQRAAAKQASTADRGTQSDPVKQLPDPKMTDRIASLQEVVKNITNSNASLENQKQDLSKKADELRSKIESLNETVNIRNENLRGLKLQLQVERERTAQQNEEISRLKKEIAGVRLVNSQLYSSTQLTLVSPKAGKASPIRKDRDGAQQSMEFKLVPATEERPDKSSLGAAKGGPKEVKSLTSFVEEEENVNDLIAKVGRENEEMKEKTRASEAQVNKLNQALALSQATIKGLETKLSELSLDVATKDSQIKNLQTHNKALFDKNAEASATSSPTAKLVRESKSVQVCTVIDESHRLRQLAEELREKDLELSSAALQMQELADELAAKEKALEELRVTLKSVYSKKQYLMNLILKLDDDIYVGGRPIKKLNDQSLDKLLDHAIDTSRGTTQARSSFSLPTRSSINMIKLKAPEQQAHKHLQVIDHTKPAVPSSHSQKAQNEKILELAREVAELRALIDQFVEKEEKFKFDLVQIVDSNSKAHPEEAVAYAAMRAEIDTQQPAEAELATGLNYSAVLKLIQFINLHPGKGVPQVRHEESPNQPAYDFHNPPDPYSEDNLILEYLKRNQEYQAKLKELTSRKVAILSENLQQAQADPSRCTRGVESLQQMIECLKPFSESGT